MGGELPDNRGPLLNVSVEYLPLDFLLTFSQENPMQAAHLVLDAPLGLIVDSQLLLSALEDLLVVPAYVLEAL